METKCSEGNKMLRDKCDIQIGLRVSEDMNKKIIDFMKKKGITTRAGAVRVIVTEKFDETVGRYE